MLWKQGTIFVVLLFYGLAFAPSIHANISKDSELVEITTEVCGLPGMQPSTIKLTRKEADEVDQLFEDVRERLDRVETREEAVEIFNEALVELDKYDLLGALSVEQAQKLVTGRFQNPRMMEIAEKIYEKYQITADIDKNILCLVEGSIGNALLSTISAGPLARFFSILSRGPFFGALASFYLVLPYVDLMDLNPLPIWHNIYVGYKYNYGGYGWTYLSGSGWLYTTGSNGVKNWSGPFYGQLRIPKFYLNIYGASFYYPAVQGFTGMKIRVDLWKNYYLGFALQASLGPDRPSF